MRNTAVKMTNEDEELIAQYNLPLMGSYLEVSHVQLQTSIDLPNYFSTTHTLNDTKVKGIKMFLAKDWLIILYKDKIALTPAPNITSIVLK